MVYSIFIWGMGHGNLAVPGATPSLFIIWGDAVPHPLKGAPPAVEKNLCIYFQSLRNTFST